MKQLDTVTKFFNTNTLDDILAGFSKTVARLDAFTKARETDAALATEEITTAQNRQADAMNDVTRAKAVRAKIVALIA